MTREGSVLILGLGNRFLCDDGAGVHAALRAGVLAGAEEGIAVETAEVAGFALIDLLEGYAAAVIIDAMHLPGREPGRVEVLGDASLPPASHLAAGHQIDLPTAIALGRATGRALPERIAVVGIQAADDRTLSEECTPAVRAAIERAARLALALARERRP